MHQAGAIVVYKASWRRRHGIAIWGVEKGHPKLRKWPEQSAWHTAEMGNCETIEKNPLLCPQFLHRCDSCFPLELSQWRPWPVPALHYSIHILNFIYRSWPVLMSTWSCQVFRVEFDSMEGSVLYNVLLRNLIFIYA